MGVAVGVGAVQQSLERKRLASRDPANRDLPGGLRDRTDD